jgi:uncharacterized protein YeaO (DUF488 family)
LKRLDGGCARAGHRRKTGADPTNKEQKVILLKRAYDPASPKDGRRVLVERLWPRGIKKAALPLDGWLKDVAPSTELRKWFSHDPAKWNEFQRRYRAELKQKPHLWKELMDAARKGTLTLVFSSHDTEHNNAVVLKQFVESHMSQARKAA